MAAVGAPAPSAPASAPPSAHRSLGAGFYDLLRELGDMTGFGLSLVKEMPGSARYAAETLRQTSILVRKTTFFLFAMGLFFGFAQTTYGYYVLSSFGAVDYAGAFTGIVTPRFTIPMACVYGAPAVLGASLVAEIGAMRINEEIDAFEAEAINPLRYVVATRVAAVILFAPIATGIVGLADGLGSYLNLTVIVADMNPATFWRYHWGIQGIPELLFALVTVTMILVATTIVGCYYGFRARGGPAGVGAAAARSLIVNLPLTQLIASLAVYAVYGQDLNLKLPIGG